MGNTATVRLVTDYRSGRHQGKVCFTFFLGSNLMLPTLFSLVLIKHDVQFLNESYHRLMVVCLLDVVSLQPTFFFLLY